MADKMPEHFYTRVSAKVLIDGSPYPLVYFEVVYQLDDIPSATFGIALGREATGTGKVSSAHGMLSSVKPFSSVEIKVKLMAEPKGRFFHNDGDGIAQRDSGLKDGEEQTIFKGFLFTPTQTKDRQGSSATLTFQAIGYPAALGGSTQVTAGLISTKLESGADVISLQLGKGSGGNSTAYHNLAAMIQKTKAGNAANPSYFILDVIFEDLTKMLNCYSDTTANESAKAALERMRDQPLGTPQFELDYGDVPKELYEKALAKYYTDVLNGNWLASGADLWDVLMLYASSLLFHVVPAIEHDALAPVTFGLDGEPWRAFEPSDYWRVRITPSPFSKEFYSYIGKVGLIRANTYHGFYQERLPIGDTMGFASLDNLGAGGSLTEEVAGRMVTVPVPAFLICPGPASWKSGLGGRPAPDAVNPNTSIEDVHHGADMVTFYGGNMGDSYARTILHDRVFEHRVCEVSGRFRLDIAPGSLVRIRTIGERFVGSDEVFFGHAFQVKLFGGEFGGGSIMGTDVIIKSVRTGTEHELYTVPEHPLYKERWAGAMLTD